MESINAPVANSTQVYNVIEFHKGQSKSLAFHFLLKLTEELTKFFDREKVFTNLMQ